MVVAIVVVVVVAVVVEGGGGGTGCVVQIQKNIKVGKKTRAKLVILHGV